MTQAEYDKILEEQKAQKEWLSTSDTMTDKNSLKISPKPQSQPKLNNSKFDWFWNIGSILIQLVVGEHFTDRGEYKTWPRWLVFVCLLSAVPVAYLSIYLFESNSIIRWTALMLFGLAVFLFAVAFIWILLVEIWGNLRTWISKPLIKTFQLGFQLATAIFLIVSGLVGGGIFGILAYNTFGYKNICGIVPKKYDIIQKNSSRRGIRYTNHRSYTIQGQQEVVKIEIEDSKYVSRLGQLNNRECVSGYPFLGTTLLDTPIVKSMVITP